MKTVKVSDIFEVRYGTNLELIKLEECDKGEINSISFVSRTEKNNGISAYVQKIEEITPNPAHTLSVAGGGSVLSTFFHKEEYYSGRDVYILIPRKKYSHEEMLFYAYAIKKNKYRYNYGRQANKTLKNILIPESIPKELMDLNIKSIKTLKINPINKKEMDLNIEKWKGYNLTEFFNISASSDELMEELTVGGSTPYITSSDSNNGITSFVKEYPTNPGNTITANRGGSVGYFFYQPKPYKATPVDVRILTPKFEMNLYIGIFLRTILQLEKYRYNYSRKMGSERLSEFKIKLPTLKGGPDWTFMEDYIKSLPYSSNLK